MRHNSYRHWITLVVVSFSGGISFGLAYLRHIYQIPMTKFMGFSNTEIGLVVSTFDIAAIIFCAPSGVIADRSSYRKMIISAMITIGLLGLIMATYPPLQVMLCIQVALAIMTILMLWSVSIETASLLGNHSKQGEITGRMERLRGAGVMSLAVFTMWVFSRFAPDDSTDLKTVIIICGVVYILLGVLCWFFVSDNNNLRSANNEEKWSFQLSDILAVLHISTTWYCGMVISDISTIYAILSYSTNYLAEVYGMSLVATSHMGIVISKVFHVLCGPLGGIVTTYSRAKSPTRVAQIFSIIGLLALTALPATNSDPQSAAMGVGLILLLGFTCCTSRGLYWACPDEARTPSYIVDATVGICSVIGFLPDVFVYPIIGYWQDTLPAAEAYRNIRLMSMAALGIVIIFTLLLFQRIRAVDSAPVMASSKQARRITRERSCRKNTS